jgi:hypothetical protein
VLTASQVWSVQGDIDGDGAADFSMTVMTTTADPIGQGDFLP